jgi:hypothetical protein
VIPTRSTHRRPGGGRNRFGRVVLLLVVATLAFLVGIAFARTLDERPQPGDVVTTNVRTLTPLPQQAPTRTITVTVTTP